MAHLIQSWMMYEVMVRLIGSVREIVRIVVNHTSIITIKIIIMPTVVLKKLILRITQL